VSSANVAALLSLVASVFFILALKGLSHPLSARRGNRFGIVGMSMAVVMTLAIAGQPQWALLALAVGGAIGWYVANRVEMTQMPELVAAMHSLVGLAAVLIAFAVVSNPQAFTIPFPIPRGNRVELFIGTFVGAMTFSGSVIAFGKLANLGKTFRLFSSSPIVFKGQHMVNLMLAIAMAGLGIAFVLAEVDAHWPPFIAMTTIAFILGVLIIIPIGGADMPVVISMLNSYSGWAASGIGFSLNNPLLIVAGALVGSSGAILSYIMCKAMNRSFFSVILGGFGATEGATAAATEQRSVKSGSPEDVAFLLGNAESVIIIPGYGLAVARAQHAVKEMAQKLIAKGVNVRYAIHPVAGRMPGHMNVLLAEAVRPGAGDGGHQQRFRHERHRLRPRRQRCRQPARRAAGQSHLRHADPRGAQGENRRRQQAVDGIRLRRHRQPALLPGQDDDGVWRCQESRRGHRQGDRIATRQLPDP
jgi:H+-translocating NAD(P) transhydrogenase subunit beta